MLPERLKERNKARLIGQHPKLIERMTIVLDVMDRLGFPMIVTDGVRTAEEQHALWQQGRDKPGKIVTYRDGYKVKSNHQPWPDGYGHAIDCTFVVDVDHDGEMDDPTWDDKRPWALFGAIVQSQQLDWGGAWKSAPDRPHVELLKA